jgi:hypothetical protein
MNETRLTNPRLPLELRSFLACLATILELPIDQLPDLPGDDDPAGSWHVSRWLGGHGLGLVPIAEPATFAWAGPWIARVAPPQTQRRYVVMYGVPSGIVWDPDGSDAPRDPIDAGFVIAAGDIALAMPPRSAVPTTTGTVAAIYIAAAAGEPTHALPAVQALAGEGLAGDRHVAGTGTFPSNLPGSALTSSKRRSVSRSTHHSRRTSTAATSSPAASSSTASSAESSWSATSVAAACVSANRAPSSRDTARGPCCDRSCTEAASAQTSSPTARSTAATACRC